MRNLASAAVVALLLAVPFGFTPASSATNEQAITSLPSARFRSATTTIRASITKITRSVTSMICWSTRTAG